MLNHHCRRNPELHEELQIQAAVAAGDVYTVRRMLEQGYSPKIRDANGWTLLHFSAAKGKERCVRVFLEHGGQILSVLAEEQLHVAVSATPAARGRRCPGGTAIHSRVGSEPASYGWWAAQNLSAALLAPLLMSLQVLTPPPVPSTRLFGRGWLARGWGAAVSTRSLLQLTRFCSPLQPTPP